MDRDREVARLLTRARSQPQSRDTDRSVEGSIELYLERGDNYRSVRVRVEGGQLVFDTHDMGPATEKFWGDSDYEFWTVIGQAQWARLVAAYAKEVGAEAPDTDPATWQALGPVVLSQLLLDTSALMYADDPRATDRVRDLCDAHDVSYEGGSWV